MTLETLAAWLENKFAAIAPAPQSSFSDRIIRSTDAAGQPFCAQGTILANAVGTGTTHHKIYFWLGVVAGTGIPTVRINLRKDGNLVLSLPAYLPSSSSTPMNVSLFPASSNSLSPLRDVIGISGGGLSSVVFVYPRTVVAACDVVEVVVEQLNGVTQYQCYLGVDSANVPF
jgi:hypothetical protein